MADGNAYSYAIREIVQYATDKKIDMIVGPEACFIVDVLVAFELGIGFAPVRKPGKLPRSYLSDYEKNTVWIPWPCTPMPSNQVNASSLSMTPGNWWYKLLTIEMIENSVGSLQAVLSSWSSLMNLKAAKLSETTITRSWCITNIFRAISR